MRAPWRTTRVRSLRWRLRARVQGRVVIVVYHRVAEPTSDPRGLAVSPAGFEKQLKELGARFEFVPLKDLVAHLRSGGPLRSWAAITFDDGYTNNLTEGKPILEKLGIPATIFVATNHIGTKREFWWDELDRIFLLPDRLPARLEVEIGGKVIRSDVDDSSKRSGGQGHRKAYLQLSRLFRTLLPAEQEQILDHLADWSGTGREARPAHLAMDADQIRELARGDLIEIGAHTHTHPVLARLPATEQEEEMRKSRDVLTTILGTAPRGFAYPFGERVSYTPQTVELARALFDYSCTFERGRVRRGHDVHQLPRLVAPPV